MKGKSKTRALGDDPLAWIKQDSEKKNIAKTSLASEEDVKKNPPPPDVNSSDQSKDKKSKAKKEQKSTNVSAASETAPVSEAKLVNEVQPVSETAIKEPGVYTFDATVTVGQNIQLKQHLSDLLERNKGDIKLDASAVENIDSAALQLILVFILELKRRNSRPVWLNVSPQLLARSKTLGLSEVFDLEKVSA